MMETIAQKKIIGPKLNFKNGHIDLTHGSGGRAMAQLIEQLFREQFDNPWLAQKNDGTCFTVPAGKMVMTTDAYVISPLFFSGGDIGSLSVNGTINDLAMSGAIPMYLSASFILEEGFPLLDLRKIVISMAKACKAANVEIITGDTKVVEHGKGDGIFITTTGVGMAPVGIHISGEQATPGDHILISGYIGDHGVAIMSQRNHLQFNTNITSDTAPLHDLVHHILQKVPNIHCLRDPTRGGLATSLNEIAQQSSVGMQIDEKNIPIRTEVASACELLGLDPLYVANEGKCIVVCAPEDSITVLKIMRAHPMGLFAQKIGEVIEDTRHFVQLETKLGGKRIIDWLIGEQLPRIC